MRGLPVSKDGLQVLQGVTGGDSHPHGRYAAHQDLNMHLNDRLSTPGDQAGEEGRLRGALGIGKMVLYATDPATGISVRSSSSMHVLGLPSDGPNEDWERTLFSEDLPYVENALRSLTPEEPSFEVEYRIRHPLNGQVFWILDRGEAEFDETGRIIRIRGAVVEINRRVRAETEMRETTRFHSIAFDAARMGAWHLDVWTSRLTCSDELLALFEMKREEFDENPEAFDRLVHPDDLEAWISFRDVSRHSARNVDTEFRAILPKSGMRWFLCRAEIMRRSDGAVLDCYGVMIDITARKAAEEAAAQLAAIVTSSDDAIISNNLNNVITSWNHGAERLLGYRAEEIIGLPVSVIVPEELRTAESDKLKQVSEGVPIAAYESQRQHRDGRKLAMSVSISPIRNGAGSVVGASTIALDLTESLREAEFRRQSVVRLRQALAAAKAGAFDYNLETQETRWSPEMFELHGLDPERDAPGFDAIMAQTLPEHELRVRAELADALAQGRQFALDFPITRSNRSEIWMAMTGDIQKDAADSAMHARGICQDISERKEWEQRQALLLRELSHRVKNSMAVIQSVTRQTMRSASDPKTFAEAFEGRIQSLASSHSLLTEVDWKGVRLTELIRLQIVDLADKFATRFVTEGEEVLLPAEIATQLGLVLHELGTNAAKHGSLSSPTGKVMISWKISHGQLRLTWRERGGPPILKPPTHEGFGTTLVNSSVARVSRRYDPAGLTCRLTLVI
jgi:PAS domain S-box-containing protein